ncbi:hypothetical protein D0Z03_000652 [Geotrichum reessii]|nr:hypothetical protein D0Z03_000652 [Galactomyces reessii]
MASLISSVTAALTPIEVKGNAFYAGKDRFFIRGVDYLPGGASDFKDPLADPKTCKRDIEYFKNLGLNTIRVYSVNNAANHDDCMKQLDDAGIYLILDVNTPNNSINRASPANSYNTAYLQHVFATVDAFKGYDNVLGFFAANEVINDENTTSSAPYVKAVIRDMKAYIKAQAKRTIPVGYSAADISLNREQQAKYFNCGEDDERLDMFGMNDYSWCGKSSFTISGYDQKVKNYTGYSRPMFLSEFGCIEVTPRPFTEIGSIYSTDMSSVFSGGLVYEYSEEENKYGLVEINSDGSISTKADYNNLKSQLASNPNPTGDAGASSTDAASECPTYEAGVWEVKNNDLPAMPRRASSYITEGAGKPLGTSGPNTSYGDQGDVADNEAVAAQTTTTEAASTSSTSSKESSASSSGAAVGMRASMPNLFSSVVVIPAGIILLSMGLGTAMVM